MNTHTLCFCFCPLIRKLQVFEILKWVQGSQWRKQRHPILPLKYNIYFHCSENTAFYIFTAVKYSFFKICIIFNQYFLYFITSYIINGYIKNTKSFDNTWAHFPLIRMLKCYYIIAVFLYLFTTLSVEPVCSLELAGQF